MTDQNDQAQESSSPATERKGEPTADSSTTNPPKPPSTKATDEICWICGGPAMIKRHCKIICKQCGFVRDCSDP